MAKKMTLKKSKNQDEEIDPKKKKAAEPAVKSDKSDKKPKVGEKTPGKKDEDDAPVGENVEISEDALGDESYDDEEDDFFGDPNAATDDEY